MHPGVFQAVDGGVKALNPTAPRVGLRLGSSWFVGGEHVASAAVLQTGGFWLRFGDTGGDFMMELCSGKRKTFIRRL